MKKTLTSLTVVALVLTAAVMVFAVVVTARSGATPSLCHSTKLSISAPSSVKAGKTVKVTGAEGKTPAHDVKATLQYKLSTASAWKNGPSASLSKGAYSLTWKAPSTTGTYKLRVRVAHLSASNTSAAKTVTVN